MGIRSPVTRWIFIVLLAVTIVLCPIAQARIASIRPASAEEGAAQIDFTPHVTPLVIEATPEPILIPTIGPGQTFNADHRPELVKVVGDDLFGWGDIKGQPGSVLIWVTDDSGTQYLVVSKSSDFFLGYMDPATGSRLDDGFEDLVRLRDERRAELGEHTAAGAGGSGTLLIATGVFLALCPETVGATCIGALLTGAVAGGETIPRTIMIFRGQPGLGEDGGK